MRRPLPPELLELGDRLERAASRALTRRRVRRQLVLNAAASLAIALPVSVGLAGSTLVERGADPVPSPDPLVEALTAKGEFTSIPNDFLPRDWRRKRQSPNAELLVLPSSLRPALR